MKVAQGIEMLKIPCNVMGTPDIIYPTLIWDSDTIVQLFAITGDCLKITSTVGLLS